MAKNKKEVKQTKAKKGRTKHVKITQMEQLSKVLNKVQIEKKETVVCIQDSLDDPVARNIIRDTELEFEEFLHSGKTMFRIIPNDHVFDEDLEIEDLQDEVIDAGELF